MVMLARHPSLVRMPNFLAFHGQLRQERGNAFGCVNVVSRHRQVERMEILRWSMPHDVMQGFERERQSVRG